MVPLASETTPIAFYPEHFDGNNVVREMHAVRIKSHADPISRVSPANTATSAHAQP